MKTAAIGALLVLGALVGYEMRVRRFRRTRCLDPDTCRCCGAI